MLSFNLIVRAVIYHEGQLLVTAVDDGTRELFYTFLGGHLAVDETLASCAIRQVEEEVGLTVAPVKLLYIIENYFYRGTEKLHEIGYYFLCDLAEQVRGSLSGHLEPNLKEDIRPEMMNLEDFAVSPFQPKLVREMVMHDFGSSFALCPKLAVINELPGDVEAESGVFRI